MPRTASRVLATVSYVQESNYGELPTSPTFKGIKHVETSIEAQQTTFASEEKRTDRMVADEVTGNIAVSGSIQCEYSINKHREFLSALMGSNWVSGISMTEADIGSLTSDHTIKTFSIGTGSLLTLGLKNGDLIEISNTGSVDGKYTVLNVTATTFTTAEEPTVSASAMAVATITVLGSKLKIGSVYKTYCLERAFTDVQRYTLFTGCMINEANFDIPAAGKTNVDFGIIGRAQAKFKTSSDSIAVPIFEYETKMFTSASGAIYLNGVAYATLTSLMVKINNNIGGESVIGDKFVYDLVFGEAQETEGEFVALFNSEELYNKFLDEEEIEILMVWTDAGGVEKSSIRIPRAKIKNSNIDESKKQISNKFSFTALAPLEANQDISSVVFQETNL